MRTIHRLSESIIAKIAAGEVIERPAYAVKELIENAIDAKADYITVYIEDAGLKKIIVTDNGTGMSREDLLECFKPHTTSKLNSEEQLSQITSLGFRGEALSSIAAISTLTIKSRLPEEHGGMLVKIRNGTIEENSPVASVIGTTTIIEELFQNVPARRNFLKSISTESRLITEMIMHYALTYPNIRFFLSHNNKIILDLPKNQEVSQRIKQLLGSDIFSYLIPFQSKDTYIELHGFLGKPQITTSSQQKQFIFVNGRKVTDKLISQTIKEAYGSLLDPRSFPIYILFLSLPHELVDVNVHPRKEQVNFINSKYIIQTIRNAVTQTLIENNLNFHSNTNKLFSSKVGYTDSYAGALLKEQVVPWNVKKQQFKKIQRNSRIIST